MIEVLKKFSIPVQPRTILNSARINAPEFLPYFMETHDLSVIRDPFGATILHYAAQSTSENLAFTLGLILKMNEEQEKKGAPILRVDIRNQLGATILHYAARSTSETFAYALSVVPQLTDAKDYLGRTPLDVFMRDYICK